MILLAILFLAWILDGDGGGAEEAPVSGLSDGYELGSTFSGKNGVSVGSQSGQHAVSSGAYVQPSCSMSTRGSYCSFAGVLDRLATRGHTVLTTTRRAQPAVCGGGNVLEWFWQAAPSSRAGPSAQVGVAPSTLEHTARAGSASRVRCTVDSLTVDLLDM